MAFDVKNIVAKYLTEHGYDGLYDGEGCGCLTSKLFCSSRCNAIGRPDDCKPGYMQKHTYMGRCDFHGMDGTGNQLCFLSDRSHIGPSKLAERKE